MRIKLTLKRAEGKETNLAVTTDSTATVGDVARALARNDPEQAGRPAPTEVSLRIRGANHRSEEVLDPGAEIHDSGLRSGALVELVPSSSSFVSPTRGTAAAIVHVLAGPDAGKEFRLPQGTSYIGRGPDNDVRLTDPMVSARHARVLVTNAVDLVDLNSANGIVLGGVQVARVALTPTDQVLLGDTVIQVTALGVAPLSAAGPVIEFNRSPRVVARFGEHKIPAPKPPGLPEPEPLPILAMLAPMIMGVLLFVFTRSVLSFVFMALSPLLLIASYADRVISDRRHLKAARKRFVAAANLTEERIRRDHAIERSVREARCPSVAASISAVHRLDGLLWTKRPEHADFLELRLGIGASPSQCKIDLPQENNTDPASWERLEELHAQCAVLEDAPITANLRECGSLGVAGQVAMADAIARGLVWQIAALHSPAEVVLAAIMSRPRRAAWGWLEWLPHTSSPHSPLSGDHLAEGQGPGTSLLARLEDVVETRAASMVSHRVFPAPRGAIEPNTDPADRPPIPSIVVIVSDDAPLDRGRLNRLVERGPDVGVHVIWLAERLEAVPAACRTFILPAASADGAGATAGQVRKGLHSYPVLSETVDETTTMGLARSLAAVLDAGAPVEDASDLPRALSYLALTGQELAQAPQAVIERWTQTFSLNPPDGTWMPARKKATGLRALVGQAGTDAFSLDLRVQGPHALVGGTTGAGKSEFLQTWVVGLASRYSPDRVTFLFVDYKGGAAFADCTSLPHHVGLVTDLSPHMVRRALTSLRAELRYREHLLNKKKAKDLLELERSGDPECPPSLIIIVDEFAALVQEVPEFVDGV
ncbi:MAG: FHA domain-containing protein, partial [Bifidobacteriaceae bacterium]|nr:FHA domain-containing protein [Bifidobacteriaceae bacterium]